MNKKQVIVRNCTKIILLYVCFTFLMFLSVNYILMYQDYKVVGEYKSIDNWEQYIVGTQNYKVNNSEYIAIGDDAHLYLDFSSIQDSINGIMIKTKKSVESAQIYYYTEELPIDEAKSRIYEDSNELIHVSEDTWFFYRLDIDEDFEISKIEYITDAERIYEENQNNFWKYFAAFLINIVVSIGIIRLNPIKIIFGTFIHQEKYTKKILCLMGLSILNFLVAWMTEKFICNIFQFMYINPYRQFAVFVFLEIIIIIFVLRKIFLEELHLIVFFIIILLGGLNVYSSPIEVGISWDDEIHYARTLYISDGMIGEADLHETRLIDKYVQNIMNEDIYSKADRDYSLEIGNKLTKYNEKKELYTHSWHIYSISYIPSAMGLFIGKVFGFSFYNIFRLGKFFNIIVYAFVFAYAIKLLNGKGKMLLAMISLIPTNIFLASNYAYDWCVTSLLCLAFAKLYSLMNDNKKITTFEFVKIIVIAFIAILPKAIYVILFLPFLFIPAEKLEHKIKCKFIGIAGMIAGLCTFVLPILINVSTGTAAGDLRGGTNVNSTEQLIYIFMHPIKYIYVLFRFLLKYFSIGEIAKYTTYMGYYGIGVLGCVVMFMVIVVAVIDNPRQFLCLKKSASIYRGVIVFSGLLTIMGVATALYLDFTAVGSNTIRGCQNRYLIPVLFPGLYCLFYNNLNISKKLRMWIYYTAILAMSFIFIYNLYDLMIKRF